MNDSRQQILDRVRQALKRPSPEPHWLHEPRSEGAVFPLPAPEDEPALRERFQREFANIQGEYHEATSLEEARNFLQQWLNTQEITSALAFEEKLRPVLSDIGLVRWVEVNGDRTGWDAVDVGFTTAESLIAESGTIAVSSGSSGRAISVLPPIHFVIATADQLVPDLETSMQRLRQRYPVLPSSISWISGPSRTADIEKILVLGAHGPRRLVLLLLPSGAF